MKVFVVFLLLFFCFKKFFGQVITIDQLNANDKIAYQKALELNQNRLHYEAILAYNKLVIDNPKFQQGWISLGAINTEIKKYDSAVLCFNKAIAIDTQKIKPIYLTYSIALAGQGNFKAALEAVNYFLTNSKISEQGLKNGTYRKQCYENALKLMKHSSKDGYVYQLTNLGPQINTKLLEYYPNINLENNALTFCRRIESKNGLLPQEDFFVATKENNIWATIKSLPGEVNTIDNEAAQTISADGTFMIFTGCNTANSYGSCDLYSSTFDGTNWSEPKNLGKGVNTEFWESAPSLSPDGNDLYFSSNRNVNTYGGRDLFVAHRLPNNEWSDAENLGAVINTKYDEASPFMHFDNQTLYFISNGHPGFGNDDLFYTKKITDTFWEKPQNLGYPINTIESESSLIISADGVTGYYASDKPGGYGGLDIYSFVIPKAVAPLKTTWIKGIVMDSLTKDAVACNIDLIDVASNKKIMKAKSNRDGNFTVTLPSGKKYLLYIKKKGYFYYSDSLNISYAKIDSTLFKTIELQPLALNKNYEVSHIYFGNKIFSLDSSSFTALDQLAEFLLQNNTIAIQIEGHTDNVGKVKDNALLSQNRANSIRNYLLLKGIAKERLTSKGFGSSKPKSLLNNETGRAKNRRTEIKIIKL